MNQIRLRISLILNALWSVFNISDHLCLAAKCLDLLPGRRREGIYLNIELLGQITSAEDLDSVKLLLDDSGFLEACYGYDSVVIKHLKGRYVNRNDLLAVAVFEASLGESSENRHLAALESGPGSAAAGLLSLVSLAGGLAVLVFLSKDAKGIMDKLVKVLGGLMILVILIVIVMVKPPLLHATKNTILPEESIGNLVPAILTLLGGTVGGYITFAGAHRLIDAGVTGEEKLKDIQYSAVMGMIVATIVRVLLFLAVLGVVIRGVSLDAKNPAADAFFQGAGEIGRRFSGLVLTCAAITSIIGAAYTSVSFLKTFSKKIAEKENAWTIAFIVISTLVMAFLGKPASLLVLAGALNGLILPITLGTCLVASQKKSIMGEGYKHPKLLFFLGVLVVVLSAYVGVRSLSALKLF